MSTSPSKEIVSRDSLPQSATVPTTAKDESDDCGSCDTDVHNPFKWKALEELSQPADLVYVERDRLSSYSLFNQMQTFDASLNQWTSHDAYQSIQSVFADRKLVYDQKENTVWLHTFGNPRSTRADSLLGIRMDNGDVIRPFSTKPYNVSLPYSEEAGLQVVGDVLHIIGIADHADNDEYDDYDNYPLRHIMFNTKTQTINQRDYTSQTLIGYDGYVDVDALIHIESTNHLYLIGNDRHAGNELYRYSLDDDLWTVIRATNQDRISLRSPLHKASYAAINISRHEQYILVFGTTDERDCVTGGLPVPHLSDRIVVYDVHRNAFRKCSVKFPPFVRSVCFDSIIVRNRKEENLIMFGFIRRMYKSTEFKKVTVMPVDIIGYAAKWVAVEYVHVIEIKNGLYGSPYGKYQGVHIRIRVDDIINSLE